MDITSPNSNRVLLSLSDIAQLLIAGGYLDVPYALPQPAYFRYSASGKASPWHQLTHLHLSYCSAGYQLNVLPALETMFPVSSAPTFTHVIAFAPDHPLLSCAPALPPYMQNADAPFASKTSATLSAEHSRDVIKSLASSYPFPAEFLDDWNIPLTLTLERLWPTITEPNGVKLAIGYTTALTSDPRLTATEFLLPHYNSDLGSAPFSHLHRTFLVAFLISQLVPPHVSLDDHHRSPWLLQRVVPLTAFSIRMTPCPASPTLSSIAYHNIAKSLHYLVPNPLGDTPTSPVDLCTLPQDADFRSLPIAEFWPESDFKNPTPTELFDAFNHYSTELQHLLHLEQVERLSC